PTLCLVSQFVQPHKSGEDSELAVRHQCKNPDRRRQPGFLEPTEARSGTTYFFSSFARFASQSIVRFSSPMVRSIFPLMRSPSSLPENLATIWPPPASKLIWKESSPSLIFPSEMSTCPSGEATLPVNLSPSCFSVAEISCSSPSGVLRVHFQV